MRENTFCQNLLIYLHFQISVKSEPCICKCVSLPSAICLLKICCLAVSVWNLENESLERNLMEMSNFETKRFMV